jgi:hypothetical protein
MNLYNLQIKDAEIRYHEEAQHTHKINMQNNGPLETPKVSMKFQCAKYCEQRIQDTI